MKQVAVTGSFDDLRSRQVRFFEEASRLGEVTVLLWSDEAVRAHTGKEPKFPLAERLYFAQAIRYVTRVTAMPGLIEPDALSPVTDYRPDVWAVDVNSDTPKKDEWCARTGIGYHVISNDALRGFPLMNIGADASGQPKVIVTGCYDWLHSGHVRFFEEVSGLGDLYVAVGNDANVANLKGPGHPLFSQDERRYMVQAIRYVHQALMTSGMGWMDAEPEIAWLKPEMYAVNEDGDKPEKREFCASHGLQYVVLKRAPKEGLPLRESTKLRGF
jgi:cytidyltransferase-like protein